jgi:hypothetical protein
VPSAKCQVPKCQSAKVPTAERQSAHSAMPAKSLSTDGENCVMLTTFHVEPAFALRFGEAGIK